MAEIQTKEQFRAFVAGVEAQEGYEKPLAFGIGIAHVDAADNVLDTSFPLVNFQSSFGTAAVFADLLDHKSGTATYEVDFNFCKRALDLFAPFIDDDVPHPNVDVLKELWERCIPVFKGHRKKLFVVFIGDNSEPPESVSDVYLRLHLLSLRHVKPNCINLDGAFSILSNVAWTSEGPIAIAELPARQLRARLNGTPLVVHSVDKFPRMTDYVVPSGVRIADASRVRLGAYLGEGTTVMHEGFVNFNAGTLGKSMVEGRISAGVVVGDGSDLGGSASIMGTLSGGGKQVITIGERCLLGANSGTGISLGDDCIIEAGCYITAGMKVWYLPAGAVRGRTVKALDLNGKSGLLFRRNSQNGAVEAVANKKVVELNEALHAKQ